MPSTGPIGNRRVMPKRWSVVVAQSSGIASPPMRFASAAAVTTVPALELGRGVL